MSSPYFVDNISNFSGYYNICDINVIADKDKELTKAEYERL